MAMTREWAVGQITALKGSVREAREQFDAHVAECAHCAPEALCGVGSRRYTAYVHERGDLSVFAQKAARAVRM